MKQLTQIFIKRFPKNFAITILFIGLSHIISAQNPSPNVIMIVVDDMRFDEWGGGGHPYLETPHIDSLAKMGTTFNRAYHTVPLCSPNRASILTGQYPSRHGIIDNTSRNQASFMLDLFPKYLQKEGYKTGHIGKWHMGNSSLPRPGYDFWVCMEGQGSSYNPVLFEDGESYVSNGYVTDVFTEKAVEFIDKYNDEAFFLYIGHKAIHPEAVQFDDGTTDLSIPKEFIPAARHKGKYKGKTHPRSPSYSKNATAEDDKPVINNAFRIRSEVLEKDPAWGNSMDLGVSEQSIQHRAEMMLAVDESLGRIMDQLKLHNIDKNTVIIFTSDNGYFFGEHGFSLERRMPYEESVKSPLFIYHPGILKQLKETNALVLSIDLSATVMDIVNIEKPSTIQGKSVLPLILGDTKKIRDAAFIEYFSNENPFPWTAQLDYRVVVNDQYKYIRWLRFDQAEFYDLKNDPFEQINLIDDVKYSDIVKEMHEEMEKLQLEALGLN